MSDEAPKPRKQKNFAQINGACKMAHLSDGLSPKACPVCGLIFFIFMYVLSIFPISTYMI